DAFLPEPRVRTGERRVAVDVLRDVRLDLPAVPVLPDGAGLLAARLGPPDPAVDDHAHVHRADRRGVVRQGRRRTADGHRPDLAGGRSRIARGNLDAHASVLAPRGALHAV